METEAGRETVSGPAGDCVVSGIVVTGDLAHKFSVVFEFWFIQGMMLLSHTKYM